MKKLIAILVLFLALSGNANAAQIPQTIVIDFEDIDTSTSVTLGQYASATWINFDVLNSSTYDVNYQHATNSGTHVAYNSFASSPSTIIFDMPVNPYRAWFASTYFEPNTIRITGTYGDGTPFELNPITLDKDSGGWYYFTLLGTNIQLTGAATMTFQADNYWFGMDDFTYHTPVPEPASVALGLISLAGLLGARKRKQQA